MARRLLVAIITLTALGSAPLAHADTVLTTSPLARGGVTFACQIANVGTTDVTVRIEALDNAGNVDAGPFTPVLAPGKSTGAGVDSFGGSSVLYCRFTILKGSKAKIRANACAYSSVDSSGPCLSVSEAR